MLPIYTTVSLRLFNSICALDINTNHKIPNNNPMQVKQPDINPLFADTNIPKISRIRLYLKTWKNLVHQIPQNV